MAQGQPALGVAAVQNDQNHKAYDLTQRRGEARARYAHSQTVNEDGIAGHVQYAADGEADHAVEGLALIAQHIVEHQGTDHKRRGGQNIKTVGPGVGENGFGASQQAHQRIDQRNAEHGEQQAHEYGQKKAGGAVLGRSLHVALRQKAGNHAARAVAQHEADGLQHAHQCEYHAHRAAGAHTQAAHEEGIRQVVYIGNQHTDDRRYGEAENQFLHRRLSHFPVMQFCLVHVYFIPEFNFCLNYRYKFVKLSSVTLTMQAGKMERIAEYYSGELKNNGGINHA